MLQQYVLKRVLLITLCVLASVLASSCAISERSSPAPIEHGMTSEQLKRANETKLPNNNITNSIKKVQQLKNRKSINDIDESAVQVSTVKDDVAPITIKNNNANNGIPHCPTAVNDAFAFPVLSWTVYKPFSPERKGIDVKVPYGAAVYAARAGKVVYSGDGLVGYGNIIIVKHDSGMLTAYAFNKVNLVKAGDMVTQCQKIAEVGYMYRQISGLHFEIRKSGKPLNPVETIMPIKS